MTEKVKLTKAQAEAVDYFERVFVKNKETSMSNKTLIKALNHGYEVEPEFEIGQIVLAEYNDSIDVMGEIVGIEIDVGITYAKVNDPKYPVPQMVITTRLRHATPSEIAEEKERRFWSKHGRGVWEIREDDILEYLGDLYIIDCFDSEKVCLKSGLERKSNYEEPFDFVKKHFKVSCFAESRLDISHE